MFLEILRNVAILLSLCMTYTMLFHSRDHNEIVGRLIMGGLFGAAAVLAMLHPTALFPGVLIDSRSVFISMAGLLGGGISAMIASLIALPCRMILGGVGAPVGYAIILTSALLGVAFHHVWCRKDRLITKWDLYVFGLTVHAGMLTTLSWLPADIRSQVFRDITIPTLLIYPFGTLLIGWLLMTQNERALAAKELAKSQGRLTDILNTAPVGIGVVRDRTLIEVNPKICEMTGYLPYELIGENIRMLYASVEEYLRVGEENHDQIYSKGFGTVETQWVSKHGETIDVLVSFTRLQSKEDPADLTFTALDITERKRAEAALRENETLLSSLVEAIPALVWLKDVDGVYLFCNSRFEHFFGAPASEIVGKTDYDFVDEELADFFRDHDRAAIESGRALSNEEEVTYASDGHHEKLETIKSPVYASDGTLLGVLGVGHDITEKKELENQLRQAQKMEAVGQMAGGIAHDFNNLLQLISGYAELSQMILPEGHEAWQGIDEIAQTATRGKKLINQLLAFSRRQVIRPEDLNLNQLIAPLLNMVRGVMGERIEVLIDGDDSLKTVHVDQGMIEQLLINLCVNARDAMPRGGICTIKTENVKVDHAVTEPNLPSQPGDYVLLSVSDNGTGMAPETVERIFEPFFTTKDVGKGTGLGLSMVFGIVKQHQGYIAVESARGIGTTFKIYFPATGGDPVQTGEKSLESLSGSEIVLVAENDEADLVLTSHLLSEAGYTVLPARNGREAVTIFTEHQDEISVVFLDVVMPHLSGRQTLDQIRKIRPDIPYLFASAYSEDAVHTNFIRNRTLHLLSKPYPPGILLQKIRRILDAGID